MDIKEVGERLRVARKSLGWTLAEAARQSGMAKIVGERNAITWISRVERGAIANPGIQRVIALARTLGVVIEGDAPPPAAPASAVDEFEAQMGIAASAIRRMAQISSSDDGKRGRLKDFLRGVATTLPVIFLLVMSQPCFASQGAGASAESLHNLSTALLWRMRRAKWGRDSLPVPLDSAA